MQLQDLVGLDILVGLTYLDAQGPALKELPGPRRPRSIGSGGPIARFASRGRGAYATAFPREVIRHGPTRPGAPAGLARDLRRHGRQPLPGHPLRLEHLEGPPDR